ncbi:hypothetical protein ACFX2K_030660 [Malus domestica]
MPTLGKALSVLQREKRLNNRSNSHHENRRPLAAFMLQPTTSMPTSLNSPSSPDPHRCAYWTHSRVIDLDPACLTCPFSH